MTEFGSPEEHGAERENALRKLRGPWGEETREMMGRAVDHLMEQRGFDPEAEVRTYSSDEVRGILNERHAAETDPS